MRHWYNNSIEQKLFDDEEEIPEGYVLGMLVKRVPWNKGLTKETDDRVYNYVEHQKQTNLERYGTTCVLASEKACPQVAQDRHDGVLSKKAMQTKLIKYGDSKYNNHVQGLKTKEARYGTSSYNNQEKKRQTCLEKYGFESASSSEIVQTNIRNAWKLNSSEEKREQTLIATYGSLTAAREKIEQKRQQTMRENNTLYMGYSIPEENLYSLLKEHYSEDDIIRQYSDERYPFNCDFYIKSLDLFIELNAHWTHNTHPFDETNKEDLKILELWKSKNTKFYTNAIKTWTQRDVEKLQIAKNNNLNYLSVYNKITDKDIVYSPLKDGEHLNIGVVII